MRRETFDTEQVISYWLTEAQESLQVADHLVETRDFSYALFFWHKEIFVWLRSLLP